MRIVKISNIIFLNLLSVLIFTMDNMGSAEHSNNPLILEFTRENTDTLDLNNNPPEVVESSIASPQENNRPTIFPLKDLPEFALYIVLKHLDRRTLLSFVNEIIPEEI